MLTQEDKEKIRIRVQEEVDQFFEGLDIDSYITSCGFTQDEVDWARGALGARILIENQE